LTNTTTYQTKLVYAYELIVRLIAGHVVFVDGLKVLAADRPLHVPRMNLVRPAVNNDVYYVARIADELIRYRRMRAYLLDVHTRLPLSATNGYQINDTEILVPLSSITQDFFAGLVPVPTTMAPRLHDYDNALPRHQTQASTFELDLSEADYEPGCETTTTSVGALKGALKWKSCFPKGATVTKYEANAKCTFGAAAAITGLDVVQIRQHLLDAYNGEFSTRQKQLNNVMADEGKRAWTPGAPASDDYYLTPMDLWVLCDKIGINIIIISTGQALIQTGRVRHILATAAHAANKHMRIVFVGKMERGVPPEYHVATEAFDLNELNFTCKFGEQIPPALAASTTVAAYLDGLGNNK
jgi:hypothetical protein